MRAVNLVYVEAEGNRPQAVRRNWGRRWGSNSESFWLEFDSLFDKVTAAMFLYLFRNFLSRWLFVKYNWKVYGFTTDAQFSGSSFSIGDAISHFSGSFPPRLVDNVFPLAFAYDPGLSWRSLNNLRPSASPTENNGSFMYKKSYCALSHDM